MAKIQITAEDLIHDVLNYYGVKVDIFKAVEYLEVAEHPTPTEFLQWLEKK